jgi:hypothetical protein
MTALIISGLRDVMSARSMLAGLRFTLSVASV